ncbi:hypothetical protein Pelo_11386 [Pelomyxa schiedti]|nr:hypothetical protein Pelo_11386 [Pelomyxa schiedti]
MGCCSSSSKGSVSNTRIVCVLVMMSYVGCMVRMTLAALSDSIVHLGGFEYAAVYRDSVSNMVGCFLMGFMATQGAIAAGTPLFVGITTGMCGCITTFSGWVATVSCELAAPKFATAITCTIFGWSSPVAFYICGRHCGELIKKKSVLDYQHRRAIHLSILVALSLFLCFCATAMAAITWYIAHFTRRYWFAIAICPAGTIVRWSLGKLSANILSKVVVPTPPPSDSSCINSSIIPGTNDCEQQSLQESEVSCGRKLLIMWKSGKVPFQTLAANLLACAIYAVVMEPAGKTPGTYITTESGTLTQDWAWAIAVGFCGCCSTVSTWVHESAGSSAGMRRWVTYLYCIFSVILGMCALLPAALMCYCAGKEPS